ncbi:MAG: hypothetical protein PHD03_04520 [Bacilli bacterium]|nr:hypothetical protein [Bacilli bacterium]MDD4407318.1 hypothetical protein [Bacilli bacterium]
MKKEKKTKKKYFITILLIIILLLIGSSYAIYQIYVKGKDTGISGTSSSYFEGMQGMSAPLQTMMFSIPNSSVQIKLETTEYIKASNLLLIKPSEVEDKSQKSRFRVTNEDYDNILTYSVLLTELKISPNLQVENFKWQLFDYNNSAIVASGNFNNVSIDSLILMNNININTRTAHQYELRLWIEETKEDQRYLLNGSFSGKIKIEATLADELVTE